MQITFHAHTLRFKQPAGTSRGIYRTRKVWYVTASDDSGNWGIGECAPLPDLSCDAMPDADYENVLAEMCACTAKATAIPYDALHPYPSMLFGIETALLSLEACKEKGNPYCLYDNHFSRSQQGTTINGLVWMGTYEEMMARMEEKLAAGFRCIKIKIGAIDWEREISLIRALRQRFTRETVEIRVDANGGFSPEVAMSRLQELARYDIHSIEQPIRQHQWECMAELCQNTPIPIALDEELIGVNDPAEKIRLLDTIHPQYIILKPSLHGGISGSEEWIRLAQERGIGYWVTSALESNVGLNAIGQWQASIEADHTTDNTKSVTVNSLPSKDGNRKVTLPQGLGTGQLFVENYDAIHLSIENDKLWCGTKKDREFIQDYQQFVAEWHSDAPTLVVHTSGSTGQPQPLTVEKARMAASAKMTLDFLGLRPGDTALLCMPLKYIAGKMMVVRAIIGQLRLCLAAPSSHPLRFLADGRVFGINQIPDFLALTPMQALSTLEVPDERAIFEQIPNIIIGGGAITPELHAALQSCQGKVFSTYGMTETLSHIAMRRLNGSEQSEWYSALQNVSVSQTQEGCLAIDAPALCPQPLSTNDLCEIRQTAHGTEFCILGRRDNVICSGGIKLSLETLETQLGDLGVPYLLTAVPDALLGEALCLLHCGPHPSEELLRERLGRYEQPRHIFRVDQLPMTETGKIARSEARILAKELLQGLQ